MRRSSRKSKKPWLLRLDVESWRLFPGEASEEPPPSVEFPPDDLASQADAIRSQLSEQGWRGEPLVISLAATLCLSATVSVPAPSMLRKRQAMRFHLEGWIPWPAEEFVADYVPQGNRALMVAARTEGLKELLEGLEQRDASPMALLPEAFLALDGHLSRRRDILHHALLWRHGDQVELFVIGDGRPLVWRHGRLQANDDPLQLASLDLLDQQAQATWLARGFEPPQQNALIASGLHVEFLDDLSWEEALRESVDALVAGKREPLLDLRREELAGKRPVQALGTQLRRLKIAAVSAALAVCGALWIRGDRYAAASIDLQRQTVALFERTFPKEPPPERPLAAIRQTHALLQGTRGPAKELPAGPSCDQLLQRILAALPEDIRYRVPEIRLEGASLYLGGEVRSNADADRIAAALRAAGFEVASPRTQRLAEQGFAVRLAGQLPDEKSSGGLK